MWKKTFYNIHQLSCFVEGIKIKEENEKNIKKKKKHCHYLHKY